MSSKKLSPRQKMISMMYLVLTALLAMNVSKEILNAFVVVNEGIENSNEIVNSKNSKFYSNINKLLAQEDSSKISIIKQLVLETQILSNNSIEYINFLRDEIKLESGVEKDKEGKVIFAKLDDLDTGTRILTESKENEVSKGELMRLELYEIYESYLDIIDRGNSTKRNTDAFIDHKAIYSRTLALQPFPEKDISKDGKQISWVNKNFYNVPVVASDVILSKIQNDIYSAESEVLDFLKRQINADLPEFDVLSAAVVSPKSYLPAGKKFTADIFIAASSSKQESEVFIGKLDKSKFTKDVNGSISKTSVLTDELFFLNDYEEVPTVDGKAVFEKVASGVGNKEYEGIIRVLKPTGGYDLYPFKLDYEVAPNASFSVSPTAMNVLYIGLPNPLSITVSDSKDSDVSVVMTNGNVRRQDGKWIAQVNEQGITKLDVYGVIDGEKKKIGTQEFRVKRIPDPISTLDGKKYDSNIRKNILDRHNGIVPYLGGFAYEVSFKVVSYDFVYKSKTKEVTTVNSNSGPAFSPKVKTLVNRTQKGDMVYFQNIVVEGPDKKRRKLNPIILNVN